MFGPRANARARGLTLIAIHYLKRYAHGEETRTFPPATHAIGAYHVFDTYVGLSPTSPSRRHLVCRGNQPPLHDFPVHLRLRRRLPAPRWRTDRFHAHRRRTSWPPSDAPTCCERLQRAFPVLAIVVARRDEWYRWDRALAFARSTAACTPPGDPEKKAAADPCKRIPQLPSSIRASPTGRRSRRRA